MVIWKYELEITGKQTVEMPVTAKILSAQMQGEILQIWALCGENIELNENIELEKRTFAIYGTGNQTYEQVGTYIDTVQDNDGFVWHIFELI